MTIFAYLDKQLTEFKALELSAKIPLIGSWVTAAGATLLIGSSASTLIFWSIGNEPDNRTKSALALGFGMTVGGAMFTIGAALENDRQVDLDATEIWKRIAEKRAAREASPCPQCKYFSGDSDLYCALNPLTACTPDADNCKDFEPKEIN